MPRPFNRIASWLTGKQQVISFTPFPRHAFLFLHNTEPRAGVGRIGEALHIVVDDAAYNIGAFKVFSQHHEQFKKAMELFKKCREHWQASGLFLDSVLFNF